MLLYTKKQINILIILDIQIGNFSNYQIQHSIDLNLENNLSISHNTLDGGTL